VQTTISLWLQMSSFTVSLAYSKMFNSNDWYSISRACNHSGEMNSATKELAVWLAVSATSQGLQTSYSHKRSGKQRRV